MSSLSSFLFSFSSSFSFSFSFSFLFSSFNFYFSSFNFSFSSFDDISVLSVKIISNKSLNEFNNSFCPGISLLYLISEFFILFNVFKHFLASISLIVLS